MSDSQHTAATAPTPPPLTDAYKKNFETLTRAFRNEDAALVSAIDKTSGEPRALVCAMHRNRDGTITPMPFAVMVWSDPFEMFHDPTA